MTRRSVLAAASVLATAVTPVLGGATATTQSVDADRSFDPTRHGFGFYNWRVQDGPFPGTDATLEEGWREPFERAFDRPMSDLPDGLVNALAKHARDGLLEATRTNGYCYGMVFAAQQYFERPDSIPGGFEYASDVMDPYAPRTSDRTPVLDEIIDYHTAQYLDLHAWLGRYALLDPSLIDYEAQIADLIAMIDTFGTAGITVFSEDSLRSHQILVYDYERRPDRVDLVAYDPNYRAEVYDRFTYTIEVDTSGGSPVPDPIEYGAGYDHFLHNEYDRSIGTREESGPLADASLYDRLFGTTLFVTGDPAVRTHVVDPNGRRLARTGGVDPLHYRYGAPEGTYRISVTGREGGEYALDLYAGGRNRTYLEETLEGSVRVGETDRYEVTIDADGAALDSGLAGAALLGTAGGYAYHRRS